MEAILETIKERPILFSGPMVRAILAGTKSQTRRVVTVKQKAKMERDTLEYGKADYYKVYGGPREHLWVRETWNEVEQLAPQNIAGVWVHKKYLYRASPETHSRYPVGRWRPSIFMPRRASRITLEVTAVRIERLQSITGADAIAEGVAGYKSGKTHYRATNDADTVYESAVKAYQDLWDNINSKRPGCTWADNPLVWVVEFKKGWVEEVGN